jgi:hypothetical protein
MRLPILSFGLALASATALVAPAAHAQAAEPATAAPADIEPPDYPPPSTRWKVAGVGLASLGVFYGIGAGLSFAYPDVPGMKNLRVPVVGPFIGAANSNCGTDPDCTDVLAIVRTVLMVLDGAAQVGSVGIVLEGLFMPTQEAPALPAGETPRPPPATKPPPGGPEKNLFFVPGPATANGGGIGLSVVGTF